jgi:hypothetical protein
MIGDRKIKMIKHLSAIISISFILFSFSCKKEKSECLTCPPPPPDTTSHAIQWQNPDTLGAQGLIRDVWVFSKNSAWAIGEIYLNDSTGKPDISKPNNATQWDGNIWKIKNIMVNYHGNLITPPLYAVYAFSASDMWISAGVPIHGDGNTWIQYHLFDMGVLSQSDGSILNIWGSSSTDLFFVGYKGTIVHFNGTNWTKMTSNTTVDLQDIWGIDASHIWATGTNTGDGHSVVLQFNGTNWTTIYDNANKSQKEIQAFSTVWANEPNNIYLAGQSWIRLMSLSDGSFKLLDNLSQWAAMRIRGINQNDIFQVGYGSEAMHFNGMSWYHYPELASLNGGSAWFYSIYPTSDFVLIGGLFLTSLNGFPVVIRGYR